MAILLQGLERRQILRPCIKITCSHHRPTRIGMEADMISEKQKTVMSRRLSLWNHAHQVKPYKQ